MSWGFPRQDREGRMDGKGEVALVIAAHFLLSMKTCSTFSVPGGAFSSTSPRFSGTQAGVAHGALFRFVFRYWGQMWSNLANRNRHRAMGAATQLTETPGFARVLSHRR